MKTKSLVLSVAIVAVGLFVLPTTVSMFAGQHSWYDPKDQGIPCEKCHWLEYEEMVGVDRTTGHVPHVGEGWKFECEECHNVTMNVSHYFHTGDVGEHTPAHAATTVACLDCHGGGKLSRDAMHNMHTGEGVYYKYKGGGMTCTNCHGHGANNSFIQYVDDELSNPREAHRAFYLAMKNEETQLSDANEACLGCHTRTGVNITWKRNSHVSYHVTCDKNGYNVTWNTSDNLGTNQTFFNSSSGWDW